MKNFFKAIFNPLTLKKNQLKNLTNPKKSPKQKLAIIGLYLIYIFAAFVFVTALAFAWFAKDLPTPGKIANRRATESTKIYDRTGQILLYETGDQKRTVVKSDQISPYLKDATVSVEDANFYRHHGFDIRAIFSAVTDKVMHRTQRTRGASTITQQYVKNAMLSSDRSLTRKIKELIISIELELMFSKDEILTMYLNEIPYGNSNAGVEAAARMYYGKTAKDLTLAQSATLAAIPQAPTYYSPYGTHTAELQKRKNYVLDRMESNGKVSKEEAQKAKDEDTLALNTVIKPRKDTMLAPHFAMYVIERIADQFGEEKIQKEGLKIITTLDYEKQKAAEESVANGIKKIEQYGASNAGMVAVDPKTGQILAMVGSRDYFDTKIDGNVNITDSLRQPGSSFKPFTYATAFKKKDLTPSKLLFDLQTDFGGGYVPRNYNNNFNGPVTARQALANSLNIPAVKMMSLAGMDNVIRTAEDMGITSLTQRSRYGLSLALGTAEVRPVEMAGAFGVFATNGVKHDLRSVLKISDSKGKTIFEYDADKDKGRQVLDPQVAYEVSSILKDNNARSMIFGTHSQLFFPNRIVAAKTGTTSDNKDAWTVGFTPSISVAVWVGNNKGAAMRGGADGSVIAAPIFHTFIEKALANVPSEDFPRPAGIQELAVAKYSNLLPSDAGGETTTDIFADWQIPTEKDSSYRKVKVCKANGKLAPEGLAEGLVEERLFRAVHSERPDNPSWEGPVAAWAASNGFIGGAPPTELCDPNEVITKISISAPLQGATVTGEQEITATTSGGLVITSVEFFIDDISIGSVTAAPFSKIYNFSGLASGTHRISVTSTDESGASARAEITVVTEKATPVPTPAQVPKPAIE